MRFKFAALTALAGIMLLTAGCTGPSDEAADPLPYDVDPATVSFPLDSYTSSAESLKAFKIARMYVEIDCLREFGFDVQPWEPEGSDPLSYSRFGLWNSAQATSLGYKSPIGEWAAMEAIPEEAWISHVYDGMLSGRDGAQKGNASGPITDDPYYNGKLIPEGGCQGEGLRAVRSLGDWDSSYVSNLMAEASQIARTDGRTQGKVTEWSACMDEAGYDFGDPMQPFEYWAKDRAGRATEQGQDVAPSAEELAGAVTDVNCKISTGLLSTWIESEVAAQRQLIDREGEKLVEWKATLDASLEKARTIIEEHQS